MQSQTHDQNEHSNSTRKENFSKLLKKSGQRYVSHLTQNTRENLQGHSQLFDFHHFFSKAQLEKLQAQIAAAAKKTGISSATKLALITPSKDLQRDTIPEVEWWDAGVMPNMKYEVFIRLPEQDKPNYLQGLTSYIEHPIQHHPPGGYRRD